MTQCLVRWTPSIHRDRHGEKNDHVLVESLWTWRIKTVKKPPAKDIQAMIKDTYYDQDKSCPKATLCELSSQTRSANNYKNLGTLRAWTIINNNK